MRRLHFEQAGRTSGRVLHGPETVAEVRDMCLCNLRLGSGGKLIIGEEVPMPLYWRQYAHHESPERNAGSEGLVTCISGDENSLILRCEGTNARREIRSVYTCTIHCDAGGASHVLELHAQLEVLPGKSWRVTYNPHHGELEFCNLWPDGAFTSQPDGSKAYSACFVERGREITLIRHHHLESSDKHNIQLHRNNRFGWILEDENPVIQLLSDDEACAGLCAYMWDAHVAYRICTEGREMMLPEGTHREATLRLTRMDRREAAPLLECGTEAITPEIDTTPIYVHGLNTFRQTIRSFPEQPQQVWPWTFEVFNGDELHVQGSLDRNSGFDDRASLRISADHTGRGAWMATTLGPAFGGRAFTDGRRYRLTSMVRAELHGGTARIGIRLHREGTSDLGNTQAYEYFWSQGSCSGNSPWTALAVITPPIFPRPDRIHLLLLHDGQGQSWFDNVLFEDE